MADKVLTELDKRIKSLENDVKKLQQNDVKKLQLEVKGLTALVAKTPDQKQLIQGLSELKSDDKKQQALNRIEAKKFLDSVDKLNQKLQEQGKEVARQSVIECRLKALEGIVASLSKR